MTGGLRVTQKAHFSLKTHTKQFLLATFCETPAGIEFGWTETDERKQTYGRTDGQTDVKVEIVI